MGLCMNLWQKDHSVNKNQLQYIFILIYSFISCKYSVILKIFLTSAIIALLHLFIEGRILQFLVQKARSKNWRGAIEGYDVMLYPFGSKFAIQLGDFN